ncbi:4Fe-4S binding protein [Nanoarchaeota archaeon]
MAKLKNAKEMPIGGIIIEPGSSENFKKGDWKTHLPIRDMKKCTHCFICVQYCPENCIKHKNEKLTFTDYNFCTGCGICAKECPFKAIVMKQLD